MSQQELLIRVVQVLTDAGIDYMVTGSVASSLQGEPRATHDVDLVVALPLAAAKELVKAFPPPDYYLPEEAILDAIRGRSMFNLISLTEGDKVDFWMLTDEPFDQSRFARKGVEEILGVKLQVSAPEDTILAKLRWAKLSGGSEKQFTDALRVYEMQRERLDLNYLTQWATRLGVEALWEQLKAAAEAP
jgi:hypothetical protein